MYKKEEQAERVGRWARIPIKGIYAILQVGCGLIMVVGAEISVPNHFCDRRPRDRLRNRNVGFRVFLRNATLLKVLLFFLLLVERSRGNGYHSHVDEPHPWLFECRMFCVKWARKNMK